MKLGRLLFFCNTRIPSEKANAKQIANMCENFPKHTEFIFITPSRYQSNENLKETSYKEFYGFQKPLHKEIKFFDELHPLVRKLKLSRFILILRSIYNAIWLNLFKAKHDIIYTREILVALMLFKMGAKVVYEAHRIEGQISGQAFSKIKKIFGAEVFNLPVISIGANLQKKYISLGFKKVEVAHNAASIQKSSCYNHQSHFDALYTGHLYKEKGFDLVLEAARDLPHIRFAVVGGLKEDINFYKKIAQTKNVHNLHFFGYVNPNKVMDFQVSAKCLLLPQKDETAESPLKLFEYMASKVPIVASGTQPIREILNHDNSYLFEPNDLENFKAQIVKCLKEEAQSQKIANNAYVEFKEKYTWERRAKKVIDLIKEKF